VEEKDVARLRDLAHLVHVQRMLRVRVWQASKESQDPVRFRVQSREAESDQTREGGGRRSACLWRLRLPLTS
jgi:hypothetical protein